MAMAEQPSSKGIAEPGHGPNPMREASPFTEEQEARIRQIAREEAIKAVVAGSKVQASLACMPIIEAHRLSASEVAAFLDGSLELVKIG